MKVVIIGLGSVGTRHLKNLLSLGIRDIILYRVQGTGNEYRLPEIRTMAELDLICPDLVIIANPTGQHYPYLAELLPKPIHILCEKPLVTSTAELDSLVHAFKDKGRIFRVAFVMRYHPCVKKVKKILQEGLIGKALYGRFFVGQYLPDWRPGKDHFQSYSAHHQQGGGVTLDLIHEIDMATYLLGNLSDDFYSMAERVSDVTADSEDIVEITGKTIHGVPVNIHMDYLYRGFKRNFLIAGHEGNIHCDLFSNQVKVTGSENKVILEESNPGFERNMIFLEMIQDFIREINDPGKQCLLPDFWENHPVMRIASCVREKIIKP